MTTIPISISRVNQVDASRLDVEILAMLKEQLVLAIDLLVSSTRAERVGYLGDRYVLPCVRNDACAPGVLALPLEAYESFSNALTLV
ncbi:hypothetical protein FRX31_017576 [Thalictrum thalictroides]|uniref:Uncharacterized protein n=1 Tax=Thalictrum thalictroides TaxID=46969 RepID=A0A7J6W627_THATH|nr:hypothetical protein FRX31_017576 [Thalictrum thalictroides]